MNRLLGTGLVAGAAALFGMLSYVARNAAANGLDTLPFVAWRAGLGTAALLTVGFFVGRRFGGHGRWPDLRRLARDRQIALLAACAFGALLNIAVFAAFMRTSIAIALICFYSFPAIVTLAAVPLYKERLNGPRLAALLLSSAGLALVVLGPLLGSGGMVVDLVGVGLAFFAAVCQAAFVLICGRGFSPLPSLHVSVFVIFGAAALSVPLALVGGDLAGLLVPLQDSASWIWVLAGGLLGAAIPTVAFVSGIGRIGPSRAAILMTIEPLVGVTIAALLLGEQPTALQLMGGLAVLVGAAALQVMPRTHVPAEVEYGSLA